MYVNPFYAGVACTLLAVFGLIILAAWISGRRK